MKHQQGLDLILDLPLSSNGCQKYMFGGYYYGLSNCVHYWMWSN